MSNIYVASSWRNEYQQAIVSILRKEGYGVYDFRNPGPGDRGFAWSEIDPLWKLWRMDQIRSALENPIAKTGYLKDFTAMSTCDIGVLVLPAGTSSHMEAGWIVGAGKPLIIYCPIFERVEAELMHRMAAAIVCDTTELVEKVKKLEAQVCDRIFDPCREVLGRGDPDLFYDDP